MTINKPKQKLTAVMAASGFSCVASEQYLLGRYGATMSLSNLATELGTTGNALRIRQFRLGDLPTPIPGLRERRWPTVVIAAWISSLTSPSDLAAQTRAPKSLATAVKRRGRPRKCRPLGSRSGVATP